MTDYTASQGEREKQKFIEVEQEDGTILYAQRVANSEDGKVLMGFNEEADTKFELLLQSLTETNKRLDNVAALLELMASR
jgi:hypothetical protein